MLSVSTWISSRNLLWVAALLFASAVQAQEVRQFYRGARALGMGGAGIAVVNDETALLVNPAGLGKLRDIYGTLLDPEIEGSDNWFNLYKNKSFTAAFSPDQMSPTLQESLGTAYHARATLFPSFVVKNFGIGILGRYTLDARVDETMTEQQTFYQDDLALILGFNFKIWGGRIKLGATGKFLSRIEVDKTLPLTGPLDVKSNASEGAAIGADVGLSLTAPWAWLPTLSMVARDVGGTKFNAGAGLRMTTTERPKPLTQDLDVGLAVFPIHSQSSRSTFTVEYNRVQEASQAVDKTRYAHVGYEFNYGDLLFLRAGMNGRYWTTGFEIASESTQIQFAYYGEDIGTDGHPEEQRRWVWKFVYRF